MVVRTHYTAQNILGGKEGPFPHICKIAVNSIVFLGFWGATAPVLCTAPGPLSPGSFWGIAWGFHLLSLCYECEFVSMMETKVWHHSFLNFLALAWLSQFVFTKDLHCNIEDNQHLKKFCEICMVQGKDKTAERRSCVTDGNGLSNSESRDHGSQAFQYGRCCAQPDCTVE